MTLIQRVASYLHPLLAVTIGSLFVILLFIIKFEDPTKNGISYVIGKRHTEETIPINEAPKKFLSSGVLIGSGVPVGREAPALIIGSAIAIRIARFFKIPSNRLYQAITVGSAASTGALFQAPFGSAIFAAEVPYKEDADEPILMVAFLASVVAAVTAFQFISAFSKIVTPIDFHIFTLPIKPVLVVNFETATLSILLGAIAGLVGRLFIIYYNWFDRESRRRFSGSTRLLVGLLLALLSLATGILILQDITPFYHISIFDLINKLVIGRQYHVVYLLIPLILVQIISTSSFVGSGFPGGVFAPSLAVGGYTGILFSTFLGVHDPTTVFAWVIISMSATHAATTKTPIASVLLILEISGLPALIIFMVLGNISSYLISGSNSLYKGQIRSRDAKILKQLHEYDRHENLLVKEIMTPRNMTVTVSSTVTLSQAKEKLESSGKREFPVLSESGKVLGMLDLDTAQKHFTDRPQLRISELMNKDFPQINEAMNGKEALYSMLEFDVERAPVLSEENELLGIISIKDIVHRG